MSLKDRIFRINRNKAEAKVTKYVTDQVNKELGNKSLAYVSRVVRGTIAIMGVDQVRKQVIKGIESDLKRDVKNRPEATAEDLISDAVNTPDYMLLLKDLGMDKENLLYLAGVAIQEGKNNDPNK